MKVLNLVAYERARFYQQQIEALDRAGVDCTTLPVPGTPSDGDPRSVVDYARLYPTALRASLGDYDVIHANFGLTAPHAIAQPRLPTVVTFWGTDVYGKYGWVSKACAPLADASVVMSERMADELCGECHVIPHGVDTEKFRPMPREEARRDVGWDPDAKHVLFPYSEDREVKNYPLARRVVERVDAELDDDVRLRTISGEPHERVAVYMNAADALLLTSRWEGSPNAVKEAMACNVPVVATDVGDTRERLDGVTHSHIGRTEEELVDGVTSVLQAGERSDGRAAVAELSYDRMAQRLLDLYERVAAT